LRDGKNGGDFLISGEHFLISRARFAQGRILRGSFFVVRGAKIFAINEAHLRSIARSFPGAIEWRAAPDDG